MSALPARPPRRCCVQHAPEAAIAARASAVSGYKPPSAFAAVHSLTTRAVSAAVRLHAEVRGRTRQQFHFAKQNSTAAAASMSVFNCGAFHRLLPPARSFGLQPPEVVASLTGMGLQEPLASDIATVASRRSVAPATVGARRTSIICRPHCLAVAVHSAPCMSYSECRTRFVARPSALSSMQTRCAGRGAERSGAAAPPS